MQNGNTILTNIHLHTQLQREKNKLFFVLTWCSGSSLFEVTIFRAVSPYMPHVPTLEATPILWLSFLLFDVLIFLIFLLFYSDKKISKKKKIMSPQEGMENMPDLVQVK